MPIFSVALDLLPERTRSQSADNIALAESIHNALSDRLGASDGEIYADRKAAYKVGDRARRAYLRSKPTLPDGFTVKARYDPFPEGGIGWTLYLAPIKPGK
ncbi:MAG: hypothetical protein ACYDAK_12970 [Candidatus Limnocylindrales bacterium]